MFLNENFKIEDNVKIEIVDNARNRITVFSPSWDCNRKYDVNEYQAYPTVKIKHTSNGIGKSKLMRRLISERWKEVRVGHGCVVFYAL